MELMKKNIHMDWQGNMAFHQITLEEDFVVPDTKADASRIIFEKAQVKIDEVKRNGEQALVNGEIAVSIVYQTEDETSPIARVIKVIPFKEEVYLEDSGKNANVECKWELDDLSVGIINSRKLNVRAIISLKLCESKIYDEEAAVSLVSDEAVEYRQKQLDIAQLAISKKDIYRIRQEMEIANNLPNIKEILWESIHVCNMNFRMQTDKILVQGELHVFVLFEGEGEERPIRFFENTVPFHGEVECSGAMDGMIPDITCRLSHTEIDKKPDFDGEERMLVIDAVLGLTMKLYNEERISLLSDVYGVSKEITASTKPGSFRRLLVRNDGSLKIDEKIKLRENSPNPLQILHCEGETFVDEVNQAENAVEIAGTLLLKCLYVTGDDRMPYCSFKEAVPFRYTMDAKGITPECSVLVNTCVEQMTPMLLDSEEIEVKAFVNVSLIVFDEKKEEIISSVDVKELDAGKLKKLPSMVIHVVQEKDSLWDIGKKYYVPVKRIKELNGLTQDECRPFDKLLIVKE